MSSNKLKKLYLKDDIIEDYDKGYSIQTIADRYRKSQEIDNNNKITGGKAYKTVCKIIYDYIMERGHI